MAAEEEILGLLHICFLSKEEEDDAVIFEEQKRDEVVQYNSSILGCLSTVQNFNKRGLKDATVKAWKVKEEEDVKFIEVASNIFKIILGSLNVSTFASESGPWLNEDYVFLTIPWSPDIYMPTSRINKCKIWIQIHRLPIDRRGVAGEDGIPQFDREENSLEALYPDVYRNVHEYGMGIDIAKGVFGIYQGASNHEELHNLMKATIMIRRLKKEVLSELPPSVKSVKLLGTRVDTHIESLLRLYMTFGKDAYSLMNLVVVMMPDVGKVELPYCL
ncbi:hypothetical protein Syun_028187 [Stephania yunnanensis]|uniref:DUF4283 domain-containing protein n=1 Tax=Stephania yunnanensis TaxID=152371 RepID=A0AAP0EGW1_9MAGN